MRYDLKLGVTGMEAIDLPTNLVEEIRLYLRDTNTSPVMLARKVGKDGHIINDILFRGRQVTDAVADRIRQAIEDNPSGCGEARRMRTSYLLLKNPPAVPVSVTSCFYCGIRSDIGCAHSEVHQAA